MKLVSYTNVTPDDEVKIVLDDPSTELRVIALLKRTIERELDGSSSVNLTEGAIEEVSKIIDDVLDVEGYGLIEGVDSKLLKEEDDRPKFDYEDVGY